MLVVVASPRDDAAKALVSRWADQDAALLTPRDLSLAGWRFDPSAPARGGAVVDGRRVPVREIHGVLTRLPSIFPEDLAHIVAADREYVAEEMSAFLLAWLTSLRCPVVNPPVPPSLGGPNWRQIQWRHAAIGAGLRVAEPSAESPEMDVQTAVVAAGKCVGAVGPLAGQLVHLAASAGVGLVSFRISVSSGVPTFIDADLWPDPCDSGADDVLLTWFGEGS